MITINNFEEAAALIKETQDQLNELRRYCLRVSNGRFNDQPKTMVARVLNIFSESGQSLRATEVLREYEDRGWPREKYPTREALYDAIYVTLVYLYRRKGLLTKDGPEFGSKFCLARHAF